MISTGNDIIALKSINIQRTTEERFYSKILSPAEVEQYASGNYYNLSFENYVWLLWSIKESAYKFCKRNFTRLVFSPKKIICRALGAPQKKGVYRLVKGAVEQTCLAGEACWCSVISAESGTYYSRSIVTSEIIYTVVSDTDNFENTCWGIKYIDDANPMRQSESVRHFALEKFKSIYPGTALSLIKSQIGYPVLKINGEETNIPISFTHHDRFVGYSFIH